MKKANSDFLFTKDSSMRNICFYLYHIKYQKEMQMLKIKQEEHQRVSLTELNLHHELNNPDLQIQLEQITYSVCAKFQNIDHTCLVDLIDYIGELDNGSCEIFYKDSGNKKPREFNIIVELLVFVLLKCGNPCVLYYIKLLSMAYPIQNNNVLMYMS